MNDFCAEPLRLTKRLQQELKVLSVVFVVYRSAMEQSVNGMPANGVLQGRHLLSNKRSEHLSGSFNTSKRDLGLLQRKISVVNKSVFRFLFSKIIFTINNTYPNLNPRTKNLPFSQWVSSPLKHRNTHTQRTALCVCVCETKNSFVRVCVCVCAEHLAVILIHPYR